MKPVNFSPISDSTPRLRAGLKYVSQSEFADAVTQQLGKRRVTIMQDDAVVRAYEARAGGRGYQTLIVEALRRGLQADAARDDLREVLRRLRSGYASLTRLFADTPVSEELLAQLNLRLQDSMLF